MFMSSKTTKFSDKEHAFSWWLVASRCLISPTEHETHKKTAQPIGCNPIYNVNVAYATYLCGLCHIFIAESTDTQLILYTIIVVNPLQSYSTLLSNNSKWPIIRIKVLINEVKLRLWPIKRNQVFPITALGSQLYTIESFFLERIWSGFKSVGAYSI